MKNLWILAGIMLALSTPIVLAHDEDTIMALLAEQRKQNEQLLEQVKLLQEQNARLIETLNKFVEEWEAKNEPPKVENILTAENADKFLFDASHKDKKGYAGHPKNVSDEVDRESTAEWSKYSVQQKPGSGEGWWQVNLRIPYRARYIVVVGYSRGDHYPKDWWLSGSNDGNSWQVIHRFASSPDRVKPPPDWHLHVGSKNRPYADGKSWNDVKDNPREWVKISDPGFYRYYRITVSDCINGIYAHHERRVICRIEQLAPKMIHTDTADLLELGNDGTEYTRVNRITRWIHWK